MTRPELAYTIVRLRNKLDILTVILNDSIGMGKEESYSEAIHMNISQLLLDISEIVYE